MSDSTIAQQWINAAAKLRDQAENQRAAAKALDEGAIALESTIDEKIRLRNELRFRLANPLARGGVKTERERVEVQNQLDRLEQSLPDDYKRLEQLKTDRGEYVNLAANSENAAEDALEKAKTATEGPPNAPTITAPIESSLGRTPDGRLTNDQGIIVNPVNGPAGIATVEGTRLTNEPSDFGGFTTVTNEDGSTTTFDASGRVIVPESEIIQQPPAVGAPEAPFDDVFRTETDELGNTITFDSSGRVVSTSTNPSVTKGLGAESKATQAQATLQDVVNFNLEKDWRLRLSISKNGEYLYNVKEPGILGPLVNTGGVIFPYTPQIQINYAATYESTSIPHTNFAFYQYKNSSVAPLTIMADFTAQDTFEANYLLAVIHFFRSVTKMFYGKDSNPKLGTPPPLCYLNGYGPYQFNNHAVVVSEFSYTLPKDVDYIRAGNPNYPAGVTQDVNIKKKDPVQGSERLTNGTGNILPGGEPPMPKWNTVNGGTVDPTYVPTKIQFSITCLPIVARGDIVNNFSLKDYATGQLLLGSTRQGGGIW